jgi:tetratricopeptide (TPR) repeat protein
MDVLSKLQHATELHRAGHLAQAAALYQEVLLHQPGHADALHLTGLIALQQGDAHRARDLIEQALRAAPELAQAWTHLGIALKLLGLPLQALACHQRALKLQPGLVDAHVNLANQLHQLGQAGLALKVYEQALSLAPAHAPAHASRLVVLMSQLRWVEAEQAARHALTHAPEDAEVQFQAGLLNLLLGQTAPGWPMYEARWRRPAFLHQNALRFDAGRLWDGRSPLRGRRLLLLAEQGLGDAIQFARHALWLAQQGAQVVLETPQPLMRLMQGLGVHQDLKLPAREDMGGVLCIPKGAPLPEADLHLPLMSAAGRLAGGDTPPQAAPPLWQGPYLNPPPDLASRWADALNARMGPRRLPRVGLVWKAGNNPAGQARQLPAQQLAEALASVASSPLKGSEVRAHFISLQKEVGAEERHAMSAALPGLLFTGEDQADLADAAAIIHSLDLVISVDTSIAHLAGAMGKPVWVLLPALPDWRWQLARTDCPWYPSARLFRQPTPGAWGEVLVELKLELDEALKRHAHAATAGAAAWQLEGGTIPITRAALQALAQGRLHEAHALAQQALAASPGPDAMLHNNQGVILHALGWLAQALQSFERALAVRPGFRAALINRAGALRDHRQWQQAQASLDEALSNDPADVAARWNKALLLLLQGRYAQAWPLFECRWEAGGHCAALRRAHEPPRLAITAAGPVDLPRGTHLLVTAEQGLGDCLQFCRFVPRLAARGIHLTLEVQPALVRLLGFGFGNGSPSAAADAAQDKPSPVHVVPLGTQPPHADACVGVMSLAAVLGIASPKDVPSEAPYLKVPPAVRDRWRERLALHGDPVAPVVGLMWTGNPHHAQNGRRSVNLEELLRALPQGPRYLSLHKDLSAHDRAVLASWPDVLHVGDEQEDMLDAAALCECCSVVLTVDTGMAHLAGALGRPTWVLLHASADWRWGVDASASVWYPTVRLFRQRFWGDWREPLQEVGQALAGEWGTSRQQAA